MATITTLTKLSNVAENNSFASAGRVAFTQIYEATSAPVLKKAVRQHVCYAQLTGAMTINAGVSNLQQFDEVYFHFGTDATQRIVTFGTGFLASGTITIPASKSAIAVGIFNGTSIEIHSREIHA